MARNFRFKLIALIGKVNIMKDIIKELIIKAKSEGFYVYAPRDITSYFTSVKIIKSDIVNLTDYMV